MDNLEKVEKLREKTGVSYEEAKEALEANNYDVLDAIIYLEKKGKVKAPEVTDTRRNRHSRHQQNSNRHSRNIPETAIKRPLVR